MKFGSLKENLSTLHHNRVEILLSLKLSDFSFCGFYIDI